MKNLRKFRWFGLLITFCAILITGSIFELTKDNLYAKILCVFIVIFGILYIWEIKIQHQNKS